MNPGELTELKAFNTFDDGHAVNNACAVCMQWKWGKFDQCKSTPIDI